MPARCWMASFPGWAGRRSSRARRCASETRQHRTVARSRGARRHAAGSGSAYWEHAPPQYAEERLEGLGIRARVQRTRGDLDGAVTTSREAIAARVALSGHDHRETAVLYNSLAITLAAANRLDEALAAYRETTSIYRAVGLGDGLDAQIVLGNTGTLDLRTGHLLEAERLLKSAIERERALAGDSAAVAAAMGYYGRVLSVTGRNAAAIVALREAVELGTRYAGARSPVTLQNRIFLGQAQAAVGDDASAQATLAVAHEAALAQYGEAHILTLRIRLALAQVAAAASDPSGARGQLADIILGLRRLGAQANTNLAQALQSLGDVELYGGSHSSRWHLCRKRYSCGKRRTIRPGRQPSRASGWVRRSRRCGVPVQMYPCAPPSRACRRSWGPSIGDRTREDGPGAAKRLDHGAERRSVGDGQP